MDSTLKIESTSLLAVEGKDECNFFKALLTNKKIDDIQRVNIGGKDRFKREFLALSKAEDFRKIKRLGLVRDAESGRAQAAFQSIGDVLKEIGLPVPTHPNTITTGTVPCVGIFIMPDNEGAGMLEDLCLQTIKAQPVNTCIKEFVECFLESLDKSEKKVFNRSKSSVMAYLATRSPVAYSLGVGAQKGYWDFAHPCFDDLKNFLGSLYR